MPIEWKKASTSFDTRVCFTEIHGDHDTGKTTLALTAPDPILFINTGEKIEGIIQEAAKTKEIYPVKFACSFRSFKKGPEKAREIMEQANHVMDLVEEAWFTAYDDGRFKSLVVDAHPDLRNLLLYASFGNYKPVLNTVSRDGVPIKGNIEQDWGPVNARWFSLINAHRAQDLQSRSAVNLVLVGQTKEIWKGYEKTGKTEAVCNHVIKKKADIILRTSDKPLNKSSKNREFSATVVKGWMNLEAKGTRYPVIVGEQAQMLGTEALPFIWGQITNTDPKEWV